MNTQEQYSDEDILIMAMKQSIEMMHNGSQEGMEDNIEYLISELIHFCNYHELSFDKYLAAGRAIAKKETTGEHISCWRRNIDDLLPEDEE